MMQMCPRKTLFRKHGKGGIFMITLHCRPGHTEDPCTLLEILFRELPAPRILPLDILPLLVETNVRKRRDDP